MALSAALILSGLTQDQFSGELQDVFNHGAVLLKSPSTSSVASSSTTSSYHSLESGISSMSTDSSVTSCLEMYIDIISKLEERFQVGIQIGLEDALSECTRSPPNYRNLIAPFFLAIRRDHNCTWRKSAGGGNQGDVQRKRHFEFMGQHYANRRLHHPRNSAKRRKRLLWK